MNAKQAREKVTPDAHWIVYAFYPWDEYTQAEVRLESRIGGVGRSVAVWAGHLGVGRRDLAGKKPAECALMLGDELWRHWHPGIHGQPDTLSPIGAGSPLGDMGGTVPQDALPGL